ncbi:MAG: hypothetical protein IJM39_04270 [Firmicutes bacterium]|nr:hypothetical protein [Bacillota bacterium]
MNYIITLGIFGAFCLTAGYIVGSYQANAILKRTDRLLKEMRKEKNELLMIRSEVGRLLEEAKTEE